jgi:hypothetical protein
MFFSCGSQDSDGGPPELEKSDLIFISPFDTLKVKFNSTLVDITAEKNIIASNVVLVPSSTNSNELRFIGKTKTPGGAHYFDRGTSKIIFKNLKNTDGYVKEQDSVSFRPHPIVDKEPNSTEGTANSIIRDVTFAGIIDKSTISTPSGDIYELTDFYKLDLSLGDKVSIIVSGRDLINVRFYGTCLDASKGCSDKTSPRAKSVVIEETVKSGNFKYNPETNTYDATATFFIEISDKTPETDPNPYTITVE